MFKMQQVAYFIYLQNYTLIEDIIDYGGLFMF